MNERANVDEFARVTYPGYRGGWGPTTDWKHAKGAWVWISYSQPDEDGMSTRYMGYSETEEEAKLAARTVSKAA